VEQSLFQELIQEIGDFAVDLIRDSETLKHSLYFPLPICISFSSRIEKHFTIGATALPYILRQGYAYIVSSSRRVSILLFWLHHCPIFALLHYFDPQFGAALKIRCPLVLHMSVD
jgi:hypothetical protein